MINNTSHKVRYVFTFPEDGTVASSVQLPQEAFPERNQTRGHPLEIARKTPQPSPHQLPQRAHPFTQQVPQTTTPTTQHFLYRAPTIPRPSPLPTAQPFPRQYPQPTAQPFPRQSPQPTARPFPRQTVQPTAQPFPRQDPQSFPPLPTAQPFPPLPTAQPFPQPSPRPFPRQSPQPTAQPSLRQAPRPLVQPSPRQVPQSPELAHLRSESSDEKRIKKAEEIVCHPPTEFSYSNSHSSDLDCVICTWPLLSPQVHTCEHTFCLQFTSKLSRCPICRDSMDNSSLKECKLRIILNLLGDLMVKCSKCSKEMKREQIVYHYNEECTIKCSICGCDSTRKTYKEHLNQCSKKDKALPILQTKSEKIIFSIPMIQTEQGEVPLTIDTMEDYPENQQKLLLGERFYSLIEKTHPTLAGKITGMFLDSWKTEDLLSLLWDEHKLTKMVAEAVSLLETAKYQAPIPNRPPMITRPIHQVPIKKGPPLQRPTIQSQDGEVPLTLGVLASYPENQQRDLLGERLYPIIQKTHPTLAGKITGMILYSGWKIDEILSLLYDEDKLNQKVAEAVDVLLWEEEKDAGDH